MKMKIFQAACFAILVFFQTELFAQDTLFFKSNQTQLVLVKELSPEEVSYQKFDYLDGPVFKISKSELLKIHYKSGMKEFFGVTKSNLPNSLNEEFVRVNSNSESRKLTFGDGVMDARKFYRGYKGAATGSFISGLFTIYGLPVPIITSLTRPTNAHLFVPDYKVYGNNPDYAMGFNKQAQDMKAGKVWTNYGYGVGTSLGLTLVLIFLLLSTYN